MIRRLPVALVAVLLAALPLAGAGPLAAQEEAACPAATDLELPEVVDLQVTCLPDLTTATNARTDTGTTTGAGTRGNGTIHSTSTRLPTDPVPGIQIEAFVDGETCDRFAPENNTFVPSCSNGMRRNGQILIRIPDGWDGRHLVVAGAPGVRTQFASDILLSDWVLYRGWAYASQDKGNTGLNYFRAGDDETGGSPNQWVPGAAVAQWPERMAQAARAAQAALRQLHEREAELTYASGISNGGYQTRLAIERFPDLFDGGIDWEGTLFTAEGPNLFTYIPPLLENYPQYRAGSREAYLAMVHEGRVPPDSSPQWDNHWSIYWGLVQSTYRPEFDPEFSNYIDTPREVVPPDPDATYDYRSRPPVVKERVAAISNTGDLHGKPFITLHGTLDALLPISADSDVYAEMVRAQGHGDTYRYYVVEGAGHVDKTADSYPTVMRPLLPCFIDAIDALDAWVVDGTPPPPSGFIPNDPDLSYEEKANSCVLPPQAERIAGADRVATAAEAARYSVGIAETVVIASAGNFPDALTAAPLAARLGGPVLLVGDALTDEVRRQLQRTGAMEAVIVGGPGAVSEDVAGELEAAGLSVRRVSGVDRFATAAAVAREIGAESGEAVVVSGRAFPDALSIAPVAAAAGLPILLTEPGELSPAAAAALDELSVARTLVVGGPAAVSEAVVARLPEPTRVAGATRYDTSAAVAALAVGRGHTLETVYVATGRDFPDALAAGPVAARGEEGAPARGIVVLVDGQVPEGAPETFRLLRGRRDDIDRAVVFGGEAAVNGETFERVRDAIAEGSDVDDDLPSTALPRAVPTTFPADFPVITDASLGVPVLGFGSALGPVERPPVILLHGNNDTASPTTCNGGYGKIHAFAQHLRDNGWNPKELWGLSYQGEQCDLATSPPNRSGETHSTVANVPDLRAFVEAVLAYTGAEQVDIIGHSLGGTLAREWMRQDGAHGLVRRLVAVDSPHHGIINCSPNPQNFWQTPATGGFTPDSAICVEYGAADTPLLSTLNAGNETPGPTQYLTIVNTDASFVYRDVQDGRVPPVPAEDREGRAHDFSDSPRLAGAETVELTGAGAYDEVLAAAHTGIVNDPRAWAAATEFLSRP